MKFKYVLLIVAVPVLVAALLQAIDADEKKGTKASIPLVTSRKPTPAIYRVQTRMQLLFGVANRN